MTRQQSRSSDNLTRRIIDAEGQITTGDIINALGVAVGHGAEVHVHVDANLKPDSKKLKAYLKGVLQWADKRLRLQTMMALAAEDTPAAVIPPTFEFSFEDVAVPPTLRREPASADSAPTPPTQTEPPQRFKTFHRAFAHHENRLLLLGEPGAGKTTILLTLARAAALACAGNPLAPVPVFASIHTWDHKTPLEQWAREKRQLQGVDFGSRPPLYLFDGLDELGGPRPVDPKRPDGEQYDPRADFIAALDDLPDEATLLISSRIKDYGEIGEQVRLPGAATLQPLADAQVESYLEAHDQSTLWETIREDESLLAMARTPLLLALLTIGFAGKEAELTGITRDDVFDHYIHARFEHEEARLPAGESLPFDEATARELLGRIAARMWRNPWGPQMSLSLDEIRVLTAHTSELVAFGQYMHILRYLSNDRVQFIHLALRDYCGVTAFLQALDDGDWNVRNHAADVLGQIGSPMAISGLLKELQHLGDWIRYDAAKALGAIGSPAVPSLLVALHNPDRMVRSAVAMELGRIGDSAAVLGLIERLNDSDRGVRDSAAEALGKIGDPTAISGLLEAALHDQDNYVRRSAAYALEKIGTPEALAAVEQWRREQGGTT